MTRCGDLDASPPCIAFRFVKKIYLQLRWDTLLLAYFWVLLEIAVGIPYKPTCFAWWEVEFILTCIEMRRMHIALMITVDAVPAPIPRHIICVWFEATAIVITLRTVRNPHNISEVPKLLRNMNVVFVNCLFLVNPITSVMFTTMTAIPISIWICIAGESAVRKSSRGVLVFVFEWQTFMVTMWHKSYTTCTNMCITSK